MRQVEAVRRHLRVVVLTAAALHLAVVICGAARFRLDSLPVVSAALDVYGAYSGANNSYGFFAPGVAAQWRAAFDFYDATTQTWTTRTRIAPNLELAIVESTITSLFSNENVKEALAESWAGTALAETPSASLVVVRAEAFALPSMERYRRGARGEWRTLAAYAYTTNERITIPGVGEAIGNRR